MEIIFNGKKVDASKLTVQDVFESIFGKQYDDIPEYYDSPEEYLSLRELDIFKCDNDENIKDLSKKLKERLIWNEKHKDFDKSGITDELITKRDSLAKISNEMTNIIKAINMVVAYTNTICNSKTDKK